MKKKLSAFIYPIIAACICFVIGIVLFSVALALKWGTTSATLQLYAWLILAAICAVLAVILKYYRTNEQTGDAEAESGEQILRDCQKELGEVKNTLSELAPQVSRSGELLADLYTAIFGEEKNSKEEEK